MSLVYCLVTGKYVENQHCRVAGYDFIGEFDNVLKSHIHKSTGLFRHTRRSESAPRPRERKPFGYRRQQAQKILSEIYPGGTFRLGDLTSAETWLLERIDSIRLLERNFIVKNDLPFLVAISKDLQLYPRPKWWRVRRRLLGEKRA